MPTLEASVLTDAIAATLEAARLHDRDELIGRHLVTGEDNGRMENSPWMTRTDWKNMFAGRNMSELIRYVDKKVQDYQYEVIVKASVERMIKRCLDGVRDLDTRD
jgi:hypothetical protein